MKKFNPSVLALSISSLLLTSTLTFGQIQQQDKALFGVKEHQESLLFHQSLVEQKVVIMCQFGAFRLY